jgi:predicted nucleic acid-binding protein
VRIVLDTSVVVAAIVAAANRVPAEAATGAVPSDPGDEMVIGTAKGGHADVVVTLDRDLLRLGEVDGVRIVRPGELLRELS